MVLLKSSLTIYDKINKTSEEMSFFFMEFASLLAPIVFNVCFFDSSRYYSNMIVFLDNSRFYSNENGLTKISFPFIVISNRIVHPLVLLGPDFENSGILDSISRVQN